MDFKNILSFICYFIQTLSKYLLVLDENNILFVRKIPMRRELIVKKCIEFLDFHSLPVSVAGKIKKDLQGVLKHKTENAISLFGDMK